MTEASMDFCNTVGIWIANIINNKLIWMANFNLFSIQIVANWMVGTVWLATMVKGSVTKLLFFLKSQLLVRYSRHGLNNRPFNEQTVLDHLHTKLVCNSDPHCSREVQPTGTNWTLLYPLLIIEVHATRRISNAASGIEAWTSWQSGRNTNSQGFFRRTF